MIVWIVRDGRSAAMMLGAPAEEVPWRWGARLMMAVILGTLIYLIRRSRHLKEEEVG
jgi:hypothetical protein